jgi:hypothetical protein
MTIKNKRRLTARQLAKKTNRPVTRGNLVTYPNGVVFRKEGKKLVFYEDEDGRDLSGYK